MNTTSPRCENCKGDFAFGVYRLVKAATSFWVDDPHSGERLKRWIDEKIVLMKLCADCGFNIVNMRRASLSEYELERTPPNNQPYIVREEVMMQRQVYTSCVLIEHLHNATELQYAREISMPPRAEYLTDLERLRARRGSIRREGEPTGSERAVVVLALGGASVRRSGVVASPTHSIVPSSATVGEIPTATAVTGPRTISPRRRI